MLTSLHKIRACAFLDTAGRTFIHEEVLAAIDKIGADLVVMASHAPDKIREFLVGSHADRIVRRSPVSVLVVRA